MGWIRENQGRKRTTYYVVIPWGGKNWQLPFDGRGDRFESRAHAEQTHEYFRVLIKAGRFNPLDWVEAKPHAFERLVPNYLKEYHDETDRGYISPSTLSKKRRDFDRHILPFFQGVDIKHIVNLDIARFYQQLPQFKAKTIVNILSELNNFFAWCVEQGVIKEVPVYTKMKDLRRLAIEQRPPVREATHYMREKDYGKVVDQMSASDRPIYRFIRETGCRPSEARALYRVDVDWPSNVIEIKRTWTDCVGGERLLERPKSGSMRPLYLTDRLKNIIKSVTPNLTHPFVFWNIKTGKPYTRREIDYRWRTALKKTGLSHMMLKNATRASFACAKLQEGHTYEEIGAVLGHKHIGTTKRYGDIFVAQTKKVLEGATTKLQPKTKNAESG